VDRAADFESACRRFDPSRGHFASKGGYDEREVGGFLATVLICDDEASLRELVRVSLNGRYKVVEADDGHACLETIRRTRPDVVLLDLMMPRKHGLDVLADLRADAEVSDTPVIVLTAQPSATDDALKQGADRVIEKPFEPDAIDAAVKEVLTRSRD
jgi:DNA-binding response OmpR family regulator